MQQVDLGATNLITGIADAYFDSRPCIFITGQVNTYESKGDLEVRQRGFQETDIVSIVKGITKLSMQIQNADEIPYYLEQAFYTCMEGRKGPVLLDIPMDVQRTEIDLSKCKKWIPVIKEINYDNKIKTIIQELENSKRPVIIAGAGISNSYSQKVFRQVVEKLKIPVVTSMIGIDSLPHNSPYKYGFLGAYGHRYANFIIQNCDLIVSIGSRLDIRQVTANAKLFAPNARLVRIDIDKGELTNKIKGNEVQLVADISVLLEKMNKEEVFQKFNFEDWINVCNQYKEKLCNMDNEPANEIIAKISEYIPENSTIVTDVGQNQVWISQSFKVKENQRVSFTGGHGSMGYSLPASIGAYYGNKKNKVYSFNGDRWNYDEYTRNAIYIKRKITN